MKDHLIFDVTDAETMSDTDSVGAYVRSGKAGALVSHHSSIEAGTLSFDFVDGDVTVGTDTIAETAHGLANGDVIQLTTSGTLPAGLSTATDYYVIRVDANSFKLAATAEDAEQNVPVDITAAAGGGTHTLTEQDKDIRALDVHMVNPIEITDGGNSITVDATDLDIRDLVFATDKVDVTGSEVSLDAATLAALETVTVEQGTSPWVIGDGGGSITVDGTVAATQSGSWSVDAVQSGTWTVGLSEDHDYGTVGASTLRTAAQIGNATGAADFGSGVTTAQTLRVALATDTTFNISDAALANTAIASNANSLDVADTAEDVVAAPLSDRKYLYVYNNSNKKIYVGQTGVTDANGFPMSPGSYMELRAGAAVDVEWVGSDTNQEIRTLELS